MNENDFEGMSKEEFRLFVQEALTVHNQAQIQVLNDLVLQLLKREGAKNLDGTPIDDCSIRAMTKKKIQFLLPSMADYTPLHASKISRFLESLDFYKKNPPDA
jgi:hypothetical protein